MADQARKLNVSFSPAALEALGEIWEWNARHHGIEHADKYIAFLVAQANRLSTDYFLGRVVPVRPRLNYVIIRRTRRGHGHLAVYELIDDVIQVLHFYHTAQDWQARLMKEVR